MSTTVQDQIKALVELQKIDSEIHRLKKELAACPAEEKQLEADFQKKKMSLKAAEDSLKSLQLKQKEKEGELASREEKVKKLQTQLYQLKTNKEYSAMDLEIKGLRADNSLLEEEILRSFDAVEQAKAACAKEKELLGSEEKKFKEIVETLKKKSAEIGASLEAEEAKRKSYTPNIDPKLLGQYERILKTREGLALVRVTDGSCGGCHLGLPPQVINELRGMDKFLTCESCARLLYWAS